MAELSSSHAAQVIPCVAAIVVDGDSLRCPRGPEREIRLLGIDAADSERSRPCRQGFGDHVCSDLRSRAAATRLRNGVRLGPVRLQVVGRDRYGRALAIAWAGAVNLNCWQLKVGAPTVRYMSNYDRGSRISKLCNV